MVANTTARKRTGGRSAAVLAAIRSAVEELVAEQGRDRVTIPMVAERAGVNPTSIYRRWGDLATMVNDLATYTLDPNRPIDVSGDLRADLTAWAQGIAAHYAEPAHAAMLRGGAAAAGRHESDCLRHRRGEVAMLLERAAEARAVDPADHGVAAPTVEDVMDHVVAPIIYRVIFQPWSVDAHAAAALVTRLLEGRSPAA